MGSRLKSALLLLLMFTVFGASSQATVCEVTCDLGTQAIGCHSLQDADASSATHMAEMPPSHCLHAKREKGDGQQTTGNLNRAAQPAGFHDGVCRHALAPAIERSRTAELNQATRCTVSTVIPIDIGVPCWPLSAGSPPPRIPTAANSCFIALRI